jgi:hypothetical protein
MHTYDVLQILVRHRTVRVVATSKAEAERRAKEGHGEVVTEDRRYRLLASEAQRLEADA